MNTIRAIGLGELAAEAAKKGFLELANGASSTMTAKVTKIRVNTADTDVNLISHTATDAASGAAETKANKVLGGTAPSLVLKTEALASIAGTVIATAKGSANVDINFDFTDAPIVIPPGAYFKIANNAVNLAINSILVEWHEIANS